MTSMNVGPAALEKVSDWSSGSVALMIWSAVAPSFTVMFAGSASTGGWFSGAAGLTVMVKDEESIAAPSDALATAP